MKVSEFIMLRVADKEQYAVDVKRCIAADICPRCGSDLGSFSDDDGLYIHTCNKCGFKYPDL